MYLGKKEVANLKKHWRPFANANTDFFLPRTIDEKHIPYKKQDSLLQKLHQARQDFDGPQRDEKKSCFQNALVVRAFIDAGIALGERSYIEKSKDLLMWMDSTFLLPNGASFILCSTQMKQEAHLLFLKITLCGQRQCLLLLQFAKFGN